METRSETQMPGPCCPKGSEPSLKTDYIPKGTIENVDGLPIYHIGEGEKAIIFVYDIFGFDSGRTKQMCDELAAEGYFVFLPDFFRGDGLKSKDLDGFFGFFKAIKRFFRNKTWVKGKEDFEKRVFPFVESKGVKKIGMLGTCWGSYYVYKASETGKISGGVNFHPSLQMRPEKPEQLTRDLKCPQLMCLAKNDQKDIKEGSEVERIMHEKFGPIAQFKTFSEMKHGWVVRGNIKDPKVERDYKIAMDMAKEFFKKVL